MAEAFFLKKKTRPAGARGKASARPGAGATATPPRPPPKVAKPKPLPRKPVGLTAAPAAATKPEPADLLEFQIVSAAPGQALRYNVMKMNSTKDIDPASLPRPIMLNRKQPGPRQLPQFAIDEEGKVVGRYVFDEEGKPVLDDDGKPVIEKRNEMDMSLVGSAPGTNNKRRGKRQTKEVFHQDIDVIRLRREEANPWILESKDKSPDDAPDAATRVPEHWVGRMVEQAALPTVLLVNNGNEANFTMLPLGRTYKFEPERPFKIMDADQAHKYFEMQTKHRIHDRWGQRQEGGGGPSIPVKSEPHYLEERAQRMEWNIMANKGELPRATAKRERFEDDYVRENRNIGRGLEGGVDEELDYDMNDDFQDDEDSNTFYHNKEEDEEKKLQEEKQKKEYRWANFNVGDRPNIQDEEGNGDDDDDDDDLFGEKLTSEGKRLRKMMRRRAGGDDESLYESTDDESDSSDDEDKDKDKEKEKEKEKKPPGSAEKSRPASRAGSRAPDGRSGSPSRRLQPPTPERRGVPGAGQALLAKRAASRGVSPHPGNSRAGSPLARGSSPEVGRSGSPGVNGRATSPVLPRGSSPAPGPREGTPGALDPARRQKPSKRKATASPMGEGAAASSAMGTPSSSGSAPGMGNKRKSPDDTPSPAAGSPAPPGMRKKKRKSGSATPDLDNESFPGMITRDAVLAWLREQPNAFPMRKAVETWSKAITSAPTEFKDRNKTRFLQIIKVLTDKLPDQHLQLKDEYR